MKKIRFVIFILLITVVPIFASDYKIENFDINMNVGQNNVLHISENLDFNFSTPRHGFYVSIPYGGYPGYNIKVKNIKVSEKNEVKKSSGVVVVKVGDKDRTVVGKQDYSLSYDYDLGKDVNKDYDEVYFNLIGVDWECPIDNVDFSITLPFEVQKDKVWFTSGYLSSTDFNGTYTISGDMKTIEGNIKNLQPGEALTVRIELPEGSFVGYRDPNGHFLIILISVILFAIVAIFFSYRLFNKYGRDRKIIERSRFTPPDGYTPSKLDFLLGRSINLKTVTSMIFYWADKGYLEINQKDKKSFSFSPLVTSKDIKDRSEKFLFKSLFNDVEIGDEMEIESMDMQLFKSYYMKAIKAESENFEGKFENKKSEKAQNIILAIGTLFIILSSLAFSFVAGSFIGSVLLLGFIYFIFFSIMADTMNKRFAGAKLITKILVFFIISIITLVFSFVLATVIYNDVGLNLVNTIVITAIYILSILFLLVIRTFTSQRSDEYQERLEEVAGYRSFIEFVEIDKLEKMIEEDPSFYFRTLSYAQVLNLTNKWQNKFKNITIQSPSWYHSTYPFSTYYFYSHVYRGIDNSFTTVYSKAFKNSSGSSGFTGSSSGFSGSAGGGFGGGGGGAW